MVGLRDIGVSPVGLSGHVHRGRSGEFVRRGAEARRDAHGHRQHGSACANGAGRRLTVAEPGASPAPYWPRAWLAQRGRETLQRIPTAGLISSTEEGRGGVRLTGAERLKRTRPAGIYIGACSLTGAGVYRPQRGSCRANSSPRTRIAEDGLLRAATPSRPA